MSTAQQVMRSLLVISSEITRCMTWFPLTYKNVSHSLKPYLVKLQAKIRTDVVKRGVKMFVVIWNGNGGVASTLGFIIYRHSDK